MVMLWIFKSSHQRDVVRSHSSTQRSRIKIYPSVKLKECMVKHTGGQPPPLSSVLSRIILKDVPYWPHNYSLEKNQVPRELTLIAISLACLVAQ
jgi:hypothetical protein